MNPLGLAAIVAAYLDDRDDIASAMVRTDYRTPEDAHLIDVVTQGGARFELEVRRGD